MACLSGYTLKGISLDCNANLAGIKEAYLAYKDDITVEVDLDAQSVSTLTATEGKGFYKYTFAKQTGSLTSTLTKDEANGTRYYTNSVALQFNKMEAAKHLEVNAMAAEALVGIIVDNNGKRWLVGYDSYLSASAATAQSGDSYDSLNGYTVTLDAMSAYLPFEVPSTVTIPVA